MFILSISGWGLWVADSFIEYAAYISTAISEMPEVPSLVLRLVHVLAHVVPMWGWSICEMWEPIMPCTCSKFSSHAAWSTGSNMPEVLGLEVIPHLLFPDSKIWACEDGNTGSEVVVVGGGHFNRKFLWRNLSSAQCWQQWSQKKKKYSSASQRFHAYVWCTRLWQGVLPL